MVASNITGMEIRAIRLLAKKLEAQAAEIESTASATRSKIHAVNWKGADRNRFVDQWDHQHAPRLAQIVNGLRDAAKAANQSALRQERASSGGGGW